VLVNLRIILMHFGHIANETAMRFRIDFRCK
jgi:hypothetical protein